MKTTRFLNQGDLTPISRRILLTPHRALTSSYRIGTKHDDNDLYIIFLINSNCILHTRAVGQLYVMGLVTYYFTYKFTFSAEIHCTRLCSERPPHEATVFIKFVKVYNVSTLPMDGKYLYHVIISNHGGAHII